MKLNFLISLLILTAVILSACGGSGTYGTYRGTYHLVTDKNEKAYDQPTIGFDCDKNIDLLFNDQLRGYVLDEGTCRPEK